jgi:hypothetical protein
MINISVLVYTTKESQLLSALSETQGWGWVKIHEKNGSVFVIIDISGVVSYWIRDETRVVKTAYFPFMCYPKVLPEVNNCFAC